MKTLRSIYCVCLTLLLLLQPFAALSYAQEASPTDGVVSEPTMASTPPSSPSDTPVPTASPSVSPTTEPTPSPSTMGSPEATPTAVPTPTATVSVAITEASSSGQIPIPTAIPESSPLGTANAADNSGDLVAAPTSNQGEAIESPAPTPTSTPTPTGAASLTTGAAVAVANVNNIVNTTLLDSVLQVFNFTLDHTLDLNTLWLNLSSLTVNQAASTSAAPAVLGSENTGEITNAVQVTANTGNNSQTAGSAGMQTGDALALANVATIANTTLSNSSLVLASIDLTASSAANLILPEFSSNPFLSSASEGASLWQGNAAVVNTDVTVSANSGGNTQVGEATTLTTGGATAFSRIFTLVNTNINGDDRFLFFINMLGNWTGKVVGAPQSSQASVPMLTGQMMSAANTVTVNNEVAVAANTGSNQQTGGELTMNTGKAKAVANVTTIANTTFTNSHWFVGILNVLGDWSGNLVYGNMAPVDNATPAATAAPAVGGEITTNNTGEGSVDARQPKLNIKAENNVNNYVRPGDTVTFTVEVKNESDVMAQNAVLVQEIRSETGVVVGRVQFGLGELVAGKRGVLSFGLVVPSSNEWGEGGFTTSAVLQANALNGNLVSSNESGTGFNVLALLAKLAPPVYAKEDETKIEPIATQSAGQVLGISTQAPSQDRRLLALLFIWFCSIVLLVGLRWWNRTHPEVI